MQLETTTTSTSTTVPYNSYFSTLEHIQRVRELLLWSCQILTQRGQKHDLTKLENPEKELFDLYTPILRTLKFGSQEYKESLRALKPALDHHYSHNSHHPEYYPNGVNDMDLFDIIEMFMDWKAAGERTKDGDIFKSIEY